MCDIHKTHRPKALTHEAHHIIPQAWQNYKLSAEKLFDTRYVILCPTGHRNVHFHLVDHIKHGLPWPKRFTAELKVAKLGLDRWLDKGYTIEELREHKLWGQA